MKKKSLLEDGPTKKIFETDDPDLQIVEFKDAEAIYDDEHINAVKGKADVNSQLSSQLLEYLQGFHVPTYFVRTEPKHSMVVRTLDIIPIQLMMRNCAAGTLCKRFGLNEGKVLDIPILEYYLKNNTDEYQLINSSHAVSFSLATADELRTIDRLASKINAVLKSFFERRDIKLVDFKLEFGRHKGKLMVGGEISLDTFRLWDISDEGYFDKKKFSLAGDRAEPGFEEIKNRLFSTD
ncbi:phosphoribosylaminoimidazolesuccinocarboxamide synthase [candidate division KSB1 bacterium]|nr:phosphoribosylaminoimidazolesuccinocarboxamide synthase [candidate division KSB1 bacterium]